MKYELLEHTADLMIRSYGSTLEECFQNAAYGMFDQIVDATRVDPKKRVEIAASGENYEEMLFGFLSEFLYILDVHRLVFSRFEVTIKDGALTCIAWGEQMDPDKHLPKREIKAVTYHMMKVDLKEPSITVIFDV